MKLTLLGTGTPILDLNRRGPSQVIDLGNQLVVVDCGRGTVDRLLEAGYILPSGPNRGPVLPISMLALTHLHSDHVTGLADLLWAGWVLQWWEQPPLLAGPPGTAAMLGHLIEAYSYDIAVRTKGEGLRREQLVPQAIEVEEGWAQKGADWRLEAFRVDHAPVDEAFGYRIDSDGRSLVLSGDTCYSENLIRHAQGADALVHEVYSRAGMEQQGRVAGADPLRYSRWQTIAGYHTPSDQVGKIATQSETGHLILSHILYGFGGSAEDIAADAARDFKKRLTVGTDLERFEI